MTQIELEEKLKALGKKRLEVKTLKADQSAAVVKAESDFAEKLTAAQNEIEALEEELEAWGTAELNESKPTFRCTAGKISLTKGKPKVEFDKADEDDIIAQLKEVAPTLVYNKPQISKAAILAASKTADKGLITLAEMAGIKVVQETTVKVTA